MFLNIQFSSITDIHVVVPSPPFMSRISPSQTETCNPLNNNFPFPPSPSLAITILPSVSVNLTALGISYTWNPAQFVLCPWIISHSLVSSRFTYVVARFRIFLKDNVPLYVQI